MIRKLREKYPDEVEIAAENADGSLLARVPYKWVRVKPPHKRNLTPEQRAAIAERLNARRET